MVFGTNQELQRHLNRTYPCTAIHANHVCACGRRYRHAAGLSRHKKDCKGRPETVKSLREENERLEQELRLCGANPAADDAISPLDDALQRLPLEKERTKQAEAAAKQAEAMATQLELQILLAKIQLATCVSPCE